MYSCDHIDYIETKDGPIPAMCLASIESREKVECGVCVTTTYLYQGEVVRVDSNIIIEDAPSLKSVTQE